MLQAVSQIATGECCIRKQDIALYERGKGWGMLSVPDSAMKTSGIAM